LDDKVEDEPRGVYAGSVGWIDSLCAADLAIALRSVFEYAGEVQFNAGAGIVGDSNPVSEYFESVNKMNTMFERTIFEA
jgi:salicylate synthetase